MYTLIYINFTYEFTHTYIYIYIYIYIYNCILVISSRYPTTIVGTNPASNVQGILHKSMAVLDV